MVKARIRQYIIDKFPVAKGIDLQDHDMLLGKGVIDSLGVLDVVSFLEQEFGISVSDEELIPEHFETIQQLARFVANKMPQQRVS